MTSRPSVVTNGFLSGNELPELMEVYMGDLAGEQVYARYGNFFPLLVKFIDTAAPLSVQVHPDNTTALERHQSSGKAEMWYVLHAEPDANIILGFQREVAAEEFSRRVKDNTLVEILNVEPVRAGDVFYVPPGKLHSIGAGITLCEIQQASDITYRIYDWGRKDENGQPRLLHTAEALDVIDFSPGRYRIPYEAALNKPVPLLQSPYFSTRLLEFDRRLEIDYAFLDSFVIYVCLEGETLVKTPAGSVSIGCCQSLLIPAEIKNVVLEPESSCRMLETYLY